MSLPIALISLNTLVQDRLAKMKEENKSLLDERARAEEERDDLEAQVLVAIFVCVRARGGESCRADVRVFSRSARGQRVC